MNMGDKEIVFDILTRLPVKSLMRFMSISKSWCHLISRDSCFTHHHLQFQKASMDSGALHLFTYQERLNFKDPSVDYVSMETSEPLKIRPPWKRPWIDYTQLSADMVTYFFVAGHCNGLFCVSDVHRVIIWNPVIQKFKILPDTDDFNRLLEYKDRHGHRRDVQTVFGFGSAPCADHGYYYKVVRMTYIVGESSLPQPEYRSITEIYDSRTGSWKRNVYGDAQCLSTGEFSKTGTFVDGSLYWLGHRLKTKEELEASCSEFPYHYPKITALNLLDETFRNIKLPDFDLETDSGKKIAALGESQLGLFAGDHRNRLLLTVWAMKVDQPSWTKLFRINLQAFPLCFSRNGEVLMRLRYRKLVMFDHKVQDPCHFRDLGIDSQCAIEYMESLLLLDGERGGEEPESVEEPEEVEKEYEFEWDFDLFD